MLFLQATQAPVMVQIGNRIVKIPKMTLEEITDWANEVLQLRLAVETAGMDDSRRREYINFYQPTQPDLIEMRRIVRTPEGVKYVVSHGLLHPETSSVDIKTREALPAFTPSEVSQIIQSGGFANLVVLAIQVADLAEQAAPVVQKDGDPLTSGGKPSSTGSPATT